MAYPYSTDFSCSALTLATSLFIQGDYISAGNAQYTPKNSITIVNSSGSTKDVYEVGLQVQRVSRNMDSIVKCR